MGPNKDDQEQKSKAMTQIQIRIESEVTKLKEQLQAKRKDIDKDRRLSIMHELGVIFHIIDDLRVVCKENEVDEVSKVVIELGEVSGVVIDYLTDCWNWARQRESFVRNCEMIVETIPAVTFCEDCKNTYETVKYAKICPSCQSKNTYLVQGNEFNIKEIEVVE